MSELWPMLKATVRKWWQDKCPQLGAALSFYSIFSLGPLILIGLALAGAIFGHEAAQGRIVAQIGGLIGRDGARSIQEIITNAAQEEYEGVIAALIGVAMLLIGASAVFGELQDALNQIWSTGPRRSRRIMAFIKDRFLSFTMVAGTGFLLLISLLLSAALTAVGDYAAGRSEKFAYIMEAVNFVVSFGVTTILFAMIFKVLPDVKIRWHVVWPGAGLTAALFTLGKFLIGFYLGQSHLASSYGAAGSLVIILIWIYYSAQILLFGAEFTWVCAQRKK